jgi:hypothetical protein
MYESFRNYLILFLDNQMDWCDQILEVTIFFNWISFIMKSRTYCLHKKICIYIYICIY